MTDFLADLAQRAPDLRLTTAPGDLEFYGRDWTRRWTPAPLAVAFPATIEEVQVIARWASADLDSDISLGGQVVSWIDDLLEPLKRREQESTALAERLTRAKVVIGRDG